MFFADAVGVFLLFSSPVSCDTVSYGNLSTSVYVTPKPLPSASPSSTRALGDYILAALGMTSIISSNSSSTTPYTTSPIIGTNSFTNSSFPTGNVSVHGWHAVDSALTTGSVSPAALNSSATCYSGYCDITYSAVPIASTGSGSAYASQCAQVQWSYSSASSSWGKVHSSVITESVVLGGTSYKSVTYYKDAYTLCDGHARVTSSPALATSSTVITVPGTPTSTSYYNASVGRIFPISTPLCSINPSDCDPLWTAYASSNSEWESQKTSSPPFPRITESPMPPSCANASQRAAVSAGNAIIADCGPCTIFGLGVQLVYFPVPTTVSRDMCASTPSSPVTWFDKDVVSIYNGSGIPQTVAAPLETATYNNHTFTSGTAYISISSVWIGNRCKTSMGTPVTDAILAMPSESVLSLRYSQNHFQYFSDIQTVSGYPFNFADLNKPVPYSAYQGQQICEFEDSAMCNVIYENSFNPQLAMPPGIRKLRPEWEQCQMWYGGLYDPPMALQPGTALATATLPGAPAESSAEPSPTKQAPTPQATALYETNGQQPSPTGQSPGNAGPGSAKTTDLPPNPPFTSIDGVPVGSDLSQADVLTVAGQTLRPGGPDTFIGGNRLSAATGGIVVNGNTMAPSAAAHVEETDSALMIPTPAAQQDQAPTAGVKKIAGTGAVIVVVSQTYTVTQCSASGAIDVAGSTISQNGQAAVVDGVTFSAAANGVVVGGSTVSFSNLPDVTNTAQGGAAQSQAGAQAQSQGQSQGQVQGQSQGQAQGQAQGQSSGQAQGQSQGQTQGQSQGQSQGQAQGQSQTAGDGTLNSASSASSHDSGSGSSNSNDGGSGSGNNNDSDDSHSDSQANGLSSTTTRGGSAANSLSSTTTRGASATNSAAAASKSSSSSSSSSSTASTASENAASSISAPLALWLTLAMAYLYRQL